MVITKLFKTTITSIAVVFFTAQSYASVQAHIDRAESYEGEAITLTIQSSEHSTGDPDLSDIEDDFKVQSRGNSRQIRIINGKRSNLISWTYQLIPKRKGKISIPEITVGNKKTNVLMLNVVDLPPQLAKQRSEHVFVESFIDTQGRSPYVQQQFPYTVRLYYDDSVLTGDLSTPKPKNAVMEKLVDDKRYEETRNNHRYKVIQRQYVISSEHSGQITIPPATFNGQLLAIEKEPRSSQRQSIFGNFFDNDPFTMRQRLTRPGPHITTSSKPIQLTVRSKPDNLTTDWLPAEKIIFTDSWTKKPPELRVGEPVTRTITIQARGLSGTQIPALPLPKVDSLRLYPENNKVTTQTDGKNIFANSEQTFSYIPQKAGRLTIPSLTFFWWNTIQDKAETKQLIEWQLEVKPARLGDLTSQAVPTIPSKIDVPLASPPLKITSIESHDSFLKQLIFTTVIGLLLLILLYFWQRHKKNNPHQKSSIKLLDTSLLQLKNACLANNAQQSAHRLLELTNLLWPQNSPQNLRQLVRKVPSMKNELLTLDEYLYAANAESWNGEALWKSTEKNLMADNLNSNFEENYLPELYPNN